jgi:hypothetical protein
LAGRLGLGSAEARGKATEEYERGGLH